FDTAGVEKSVEIIRASGIDHEFRTTLVKGLHTEKDMEDIGRWLEGEKKYFLQAFKESQSILDKSTRGFEKEEMERLLNVVRRYIPTAELRGI
ncbi:MAG: anaerobic ribonucleoside-triphosphate reductase activating protein, partial [Clostridia bacterium]|nr:anaerobic ribonucleoside-triphosphate reductase activating protein [Clostridia bacterium]